MIETFDTTNMLAMLRSQQGDQLFKGGQRISVEVAALLNGLTEVIEALEFYQADSGVASYTRFGGDPNAKPEPVLPKMIRWRDQLIQRTDAELHTVQGDDKQAILSQFNEVHDGINGPFTDADLKAAGQDWGGPEGTAFAEEVIAPRPALAGDDESAEGSLTPSDKD